MAGLNENDLLDVRIMGTIFGQRTITTFNYVVTAPSDTGDVIEACNSFAGMWKAGAVSPFLSFLACCPTAWNADQVQCQVISPTRYVYGFNDVNLAGTNAQVSESTNQSATITKGADRSGRKYVGSIHIPALSQGNMADGLVTAGFLTLMSTVGSKMLNAFTDLVQNTQAYPVIKHRIPGTQNYTWTAMTRTIPQRTARVMRRRTVGIGK